MMIRIAAALSSLSLALPGLQAQQDPDDNPGKILEVATSAGSFSTLVAALQAADLVEALDGEGPFTVFAPTDEAFDRLPQGTLDELLQEGNRARLQRILKFHVVPGRIDAAAALSAGTAETLIGEGLPIRLRDGVLRVGPARVLTNDILASNGVIHVIDRVLIPTPSLPASAAERAARILELAIERGVPLFNAGQTRACADLYELAATSIVTLGAALPEEVLEPLRKALSRGEASRDDRRKAWTLRAGLDRALGALRRDSQASTADSAGDKVVADFEGDDELDWFTLNDDVMGGVSVSDLRRTDHGTAIFQGRLSLENNGGFATVRTAATDLDLGGYDAFVLRVRGDGRSYALHAMPTDRRGAVNYWAGAFDTEPGQWIEVTIPIAGMQRKIMGRKVPFGGPLAPEEIRSLAFMIADKNESPFALEIDWIKAVRLAAD